MDSVYLSDYWSFYNYISDLSYGEVTLAEAKVYFRNIISFEVIPRTLLDSNLEIEKLISEVSNINFRYSDLSKSNLEKRERKEKYNELYKEKIKVINEIKKYTLSIPAYDFADLYKSSIEVKLTDYEKVYIVDCNYDSELGFRRGISKERSNTIDGGIII